MIRGVASSISFPLRFNEKFLEKREPDVEKFCIVVERVGTIFCMFENEF
jgi:hypothetical protein